MAFDIELSRTVPIVEENDTAIILFHGTDLSMLTMRALKVWLGSQGTSTRRNKAALVERYVSRLVDDVCSECLYMLVVLSLEFVRIFDLVG